MNKLTGTFIGEVVDVDDPKKLGRLKVRVPSAYGSIPVEDLPWAEPQFPYGSQNKGIFFIPDVGSLVSVEFINGSKYRPVWTGSIFREDDIIVPQEVKDSYPKRKIIKTAVGYVMFDDESEYIEIKHKNGSVYTMIKEGDIVIHAKRDLVLLSDRYILLNPSGKESVIPLAEYKSKKELSQMSDTEVEEYKKSIDNYIDKTEGNCGAQGQDQHVSGTGSECKSQSASPMRQWAANHKCDRSSAAKLKYASNIRPIKKHLSKVSGVDARFNAVLVSNLESALDEMQISEPVLYDKFKLTDGFRSSNVAYGAKESMHKYGAAFDFNYSAFTCEEREKIYEILGKHGLGCPLDSFNGQDEGMHIEMMSSIYIPLSGDEA